MDAMRAAKDANAHDFISELPGGYDYQVRASDFHFDLGSSSR